MSTIAITPEDFKKSSVQFKKELLIMVAIGLQNSLQHMTLRPGVLYKQSVGQIGGKAEFGPYDPTRSASTGTMDVRSLEVWLGSVIETFDPNEAAQTLIGTGVLNGDALKNVPISKAILAAQMKSISKKLNMALFSAVRSDVGTTSKALFNGFDTIAATEITATKISAALGNYHDASGTAISASNALDQLKAIYRAASDELKEEQTKMFVPRAVYDMYTDDYQATVGAAPYNKAFEKTFLEGSNGLCEIVPLASKKDATLIQLTTKSNMLIGTGNGQDIESLNVDRFNPFLLTLSAAMLFGVQYETISAEKLLIGKIAYAGA